MHPMMLSNVVFPLPDGPEMAKNSASATSRSTPFEAATVTLPMLYSLVIPRAKIMELMRLPQEPPHPACATRGWTEDRCRRCEIQNRYHGREDRGWPLLTF